MDVPMPVGCEVLFKGPSPSSIWICSIYDLQSSILEMTLEAYAPPSPKKSVFIFCFK